MKDDAIVDPKGLATALRPLLTRHPVPQSDERTRGMILEFGWGESKPSWADVPALNTLLGLFTGETDAINILAINENPPASPDTFMLRPHGFGRHAPRWTAVAFLDFPPGGKDGELVVFPRDAFDRADPPAREDARQAVARHAGILIEPRPGRLCRFAGYHPHAVLGYTSQPGDAWRLAAVLAEFSPREDEPSAREVVCRPNRR